MSTPGLGHNHPPPDDPLKNRVDELVGAANRWITERPEITDDDTAGRAGDFLDQINEVMKRVESARKAEVDPLRREVEKINTRFKALIAPLEIAKEAIRAKLTAWLQGKERRRREKEAEARAAAEKAQREAAEAQRKAAEEAQREGGMPIQAAVAAEEARRRAEEAARAAQQAAEGKAQARGDFGARAKGLRTTYRAVLVDAAAACRHYAEHPRLKEALEQIANADVRAGHRAIPGFRIDIEQKAA